MSPPAGGEKGLRVSVGVLRTGRGSPSWLSSQTTQGGPLGWPCEYHLSGNKPGVWARLSQGASLVSMACLVHCPP